MFRTALLAGLFLGLLAALVQTQVTGCAMTSAQREAAIRESEALLERTAEQRARLEAELAAAREANNTERAAKAERGLALLDRLEPMLRQGHEVFVASVDSNGQINLSPAATALGGAVGGPLGAGLAIGLPLLASLVSGLGWFRKASEARANLEAAESVINNLDRAFAANPQFNAEGNKVWPEIEKGLTPEAKALTDKMIT